MNLKKLALSGVASAIVLGASIAPAFAAPAPKATGGVTGLAGGTEIQLSFNAQDHKNGVKGNVLYSNDTGAFFRGDVTTCYDQVGNAAAFAGEVEDGTFAQQYFKVEVLDNGQGENADGEDAFRVLLSNAPFTCDLSGVYPAVVTVGNLVVH